MFQTLQTFPTYLLPSLPFTASSRRRRKSTSYARPESFGGEVPSLSTSPATHPSAGSSPSPSTSPPPTGTGSHGFTGLLHSALQKHQRPKELQPELRLSRAQPNTLKCLNCSTDIAFASQVVSKGFTGRHGRAYLVSPPSRAEGNKNPKSTRLANIKMARPVKRELLTGAHVVADVSCTICSSVLGWKYLDAKEETQKYKIGKYILESKRVVEVASWEDTVNGEGEDWDGGTLPAWRGDGDDEGVVIFDDEDEDECEDLFTGTWNASVVASRRALRVDMRTTEGAAD